MKNNNERWAWPLILVFARFFLAVLFQLILSIVFYFAEDPSPLTAAGKWFTVYGTLIDLACLLLISWQLKKDGKSLITIVNVKKGQYKQDIVKGLIYSLILLPVSVVGMVLGSLLLYGTPEPMQIMGGIPLWGAIYSVVIFPIIWAFAEQITYQGYSLNRLEKVFNSKVLAIAIISLGWMLQHAALPLMLDFKYMIFRIISFMPLTIIMPIMYLKTKRLLPFIVSHWIMDLIAALTGALIPLFFNR